MAVELWDEKYGNAVDDFDTEIEALTFMRKTITERGEGAVETWALDMSDDRPPCAWYRVIASRADASGLTADLPVRSVTMPFLRGRRLKYPFPASATNSQSVDVSRPVDIP